MKYLLSILIVLFMQPENIVSWKTLSKVTFREEYNDNVGAYIQIPEFSEEVKVLNGKKVKVSGYIIPLDIDLNEYVLSANPFSSCFFCGQAGPESVIQLTLSEKYKFDTDEYLTFSGILRLNIDDIYSLNYILEEAKHVD